MSKSTTALATPLRDVLERLASFEPSTLPVLSLYLDLRADQHGQRTHHAFLRKSLDERGHALTGDARRSFAADAARINDYVETVPPSANGVAVFACEASGLFEAVQLDAPIEDHSLFLGPVPHVYPLARVVDQYPRYVALLVDTNSARMFVFSLGTVETERQISNAKTRRTSMGGWSQARYQRHIENFHLLHMKEVISVLDRVVRDEAINQIVVSCDEVAKPLLTEQLPKHLAAKVVDIVHLDIKASQKQILTDTLDALRERDGETDVARVATLLNAWGASGLGVVGPDDTLQALELRQVEELLITARPDELQPATAAQDGDRLNLANDLVAKAQQNDARIRFIEDPALLEEVGGVGAILRFRI